MAVGTVQYENDYAPLAVGGSVCGLLCVKLCYVKLGALGVLGTTVQYVVSSSWYQVLGTVQYVVQVLGTKCCALSP